jgi:hypothetical protein
MIMSPLSKIEMLPLVVLKALEALNEGDIKNDDQGS